jgi:hypothetical protein
MKPSETGSEGVDIRATYESRSTDEEGITFRKRKSDMEIDIREERESLHMEARHG